MIAVVKMEQASIMEGACGLKVAESGLKANFSVVSVDPTLFQLKKQK